MKIAFLINPKIRNFRKIEIDIQHNFLDFDYKFFISEFSGHFLTLPVKAIEEGFTHIIAIGGDGTLNEVINGVLDAFKTENSYDWEKVKTIKIGILPSGSGNDFVKNLGYKTIEELKDLILKDSTALVDVGFTEFFDKDNKPSTRFFINISDVGMGGEVVTTKEKLPQFLDGSINYFLAITKTVATYKKNLVKITAKEFSWEGKILNFVIANGKYFGNAIGIAPHAEINDGKFAITNVGDISLMDYFKNLGTAKKCEKIIHPEVSYTESEELVIESTDKRKLAIDMDGEFIGYAPVKFTCMKQKLNFLK